VDAGDTTIEIYGEGYRNLTYLITTYNVFNDKDKVYYLNLTMSMGEGREEKGEFQLEMLRDVCGIMLFIFTTSAIFQMMGIIAVKKDRIKEAKAMCIIGIFSFGFGISTIFSTMAYIHLHRTAGLNRMAVKIIIKKKVGQTQ